MSYVLASGLLVSIGLFLTGLMLLPGVTLFKGISWQRNKPRWTNVRRSGSAAMWLGGRPGHAGGIGASGIAPLQVVSGSLGLVTGLALSIALAFPYIAWILTLLLGVSCYQLPMLVLRQRLAARTRAAQRELPEVVGLLQAFPGRNLAMSLTTITRTGHGPLVAAIREGLERNGTGVPLIKALVEAMAGLQVEEVGRFVEVLSQAQSTSTRGSEVLRAYEQELLCRRRGMALRRVETAEGKISAVLTVATATQLLLLLVVPSLLQFFGPSYFR